MAEDDERAEVVVVRCLQLTIPLDAVEGGTVDKEDDSEDNIDTLRLSFI